MASEWLYRIDLEHVPNDFPHSARKMRTLAGGAKQIEHLSYNAKDFEEDRQYLTSKGGDYLNEFTLFLIDSKLTQETRVSLKMQSKP